ncbi:hypothetical protein, partial [Mobiluncus mulieris]|uniref:hypothetical protein n=1 Tax=Mobiluncus mulieris TaxID=2052 RepID=UPI0021E2F26A
RPAGIPLTGLLFPAYSRHKAVDTTKPPMSGAVIRFLTVFLAPTARLPRSRLLSSDSTFDVEVSA